MIHFIPHKTEVLQIDIKQACFHAFAHTPLKRK